MTLNTPVEHVLPNSRHAAASVGTPTGEPKEAASLSTTVNGLTDRSPTGSLAVSDWGIEDGEPMQLELEDGTLYSGVGFGSRKSIAGELVFQTGMVGYPESITDPSYRGQILVFTFPLVGNYGVPSRDTMDPILLDLPAYFESSQIHVSGIVVASYSGEDYSHHLATSSLGTWLKQQGIPAIYGVDTRALTKRIREEGSMLGRMMVEVEQSKRMVNGHKGDRSHTSQTMYEHIDWIDPNTKNLVADGERALPVDQLLSRALTSFASLCPRASSLLPKTKICIVSSIRTSL